MIVGAAAAGTCDRRTVIRLIDDGAAGAEGPETS